MATTTFQTSTRRRAREKTADENRDMEALRLERDRIEQRMRELRQRRDAKRAKAGATKRGIPANYSGDDPRLCNAMTTTGRPCRALGVLKSGRCRVHGEWECAPATRISVEGSGSAGSMVASRRAD